MKKSLKILIATIIVLGVILLIFMGIRKYRQLSLNMNRVVVESTVKDFYGCYIIQEYFRFTNSRLEGGQVLLPLQNSACNKYVSEEFTKKINEGVTSPGYDHILCMQDLPETMAIASEEIKQNNARIGIKFYIDQVEPVVNLDFINNKWVITDINCKNIENSKYHNEKIIEKRNEFANKILRNEELKETFKDVFDNNIDYGKKIDNVYYFSDTTELSMNPWINLDITAYKYEKGAYYNSGYEGLKWTVKLDDIVRNFESLESGVQVAKIYGPLGEEKAMVDFRKIGGKNFEVYDTFFQPGRSWSRYYVTYDRKNSEIIYIVFSFSDQDGNSQVSAIYNKEGGYYENVIYPEEMNIYLENIEKVIEES